MSMFKYIIWAIILYLLIRFVFNFLIPVIRASMQMRQQMKAFQDKMNQQNQFTNEESRQYNGSPKQQNKSKTSDYIDFEEVK